MAAILQLFLVLCFYTVFVRTEVGNDFNNCNQFFYKGIPPQQQRDLPQPPNSICQMYNNQFHFASLYSTSLRIPLFSAYTLPAQCQGPQPKRKSDWFIEPQVRYLYLLKYLKVNNRLLNKRGIFSFSITLKKLKNFQFYFR